MTATSASMATTMHTGTVKRLLYRPPIIRPLPGLAGFPPSSFVGACRLNERFFQSARGTVRHVSICDTIRTIPIDNRHRFVVHNQIGRRCFFNAKNVDSNATFKKINEGTSVSNTNDAAPNVDATSNSKISTTTTTEKTGKTSGSSRFWNFTTQLSSRIYTSVKESTQSSANWLGAKISSSVQSSVNQVRQRTLASIETASIKTRQRIDDLHSRVSSNFNERTKSFVSSMIAPFQNGWNYIANIWRTTPIWNRFFWWSLSAIAVYGIATTLPKELIQLAVTKSTTPPTTATKTDVPSDEIQPPKRTENKMSVET